MHIELGPEKLPLKPPASPSTAMAIIRLIESSPEFAGGAALAVCCSALAKRAGVVVDYTDLAGTGREVFDFVVKQLMRNGMSGNDALEAAARAAGQATSAIIGELPVEVEVEEAGND